MDCSMPIVTQVRHDEQRYGGVDNVFANLFVLCQPGNILLCTQPDGTSLLGLIDYGVY